MSDLNFHSFPLLCFTEILFKFKTQKSLLPSDFKMIFSGSGSSGIKFCQSLKLAKYLKNYEVVLEQ